MHNTRLFDRYIAVDWSAHNEAKSGKDSIWIGDWHQGQVQSSNPRTRQAAMADITSRLLQSTDLGERVLLGFDFAFGYPEGATKLLADDGSWTALWGLLHFEVSDDESNSSNRFEAAGRINSRLSGAAPRYWGHPWQHAGRYKGLGTRKPLGNHTLVSEKRQVERLNNKTQPVWKLYGAGAVGSQSFLGIPRLERLRRHDSLSSNLAVWPFETSFADNLKSPIIVAEIFPSIVEVGISAGMVRDQLQVEAIATLFARADRLAVLGRLPSRPVRQDIRWDSVLKEEGWIVGVGHEELVAELRAQQ